MNFLSRSFNDQLKLIVHLGAACIFLCFDVFCVFDIYSMYVCMRACGGVRVCVLILYMHILRPQAMTNQQKTWCGLFQTLFIKSKFLSVLII